MTAFLRYEQHGPVVTLTMNQPDKRNPLTGNTAVDEFVSACERIAADLSVRAVIVTGAGTAFSSGGDIKDMKRFFDDGMSTTAIRQWYVLGIQRLTRALYHLEVPTIAAVNGPAVGAGCDLSCMCDLRIASESASFAESFIRVGLIPGDGGAWLLPRAVGMAKAMEMAFTGDPVSADEARACGLVSRVVAPDQLLAAANDLARRIARNPGNVLRMTKRLMREGQQMGIESLLQMSVGFQAIAHKSPQHREAVTAFLEKRQPEFGDD